MFKLFLGSAGIRIYLRFLSNDLFIRLFFCSYENLSFKQSLRCASCIKRDKRSTTLQLAAILKWDSQDVEHSGVVNIAIVEIELRSSAIVTRSEFDLFPYDRNELLTAILTTIWEPAALIRLHSRTHILLTRPHFAIPACAHPKRLRPHHFLTHTPSTEFPIAHCERLIPPAR